LLEGRGGGGGGGKKFVARSGSAVDRGYQESGLDILVGFADIPRSQYSVYIPKDWTLNFL
jgi:hypothetical protein